MDGDPRLGTPKQYLTILNTPPNFDRTGLLKHLRQRFAINWHGAHGASHWARVRKNGFILAQITGANVQVVELFAFFHDSCRINEYEDHDHGKRGAELAVNLRGNLFEATDAEMDLLVEACENHSNGCVDAHVTVQTCWDADRLDLGRVGIYPESKYLCTPAAKDTETVVSVSITARRAQASPVTFSAKTCLSATAMRCRTR